MKSYKKKLYILSCVILALFLSGCKGKKLTTVIDDLPESALLTEIKTTLENKMPLVVSFTAEWCPHCRQYKPVFFEVKKNYEETTNNVAFFNIDVEDQNGSLISSRFHVKGIPTTAFIRPDGSVYKMHVGELDNEGLNEIIKGLLKSKRKKRREPIAPFPIEPQEVKEEIIEPEPVQ